MEDLEKLYKKLEKYKDFSIEENCEKFLETVDEIVIKQDPKSIPILLNYFKDDSEYSWVFTCLRKSLEYFPQNIYITVIINNISRLVENCPKCLDEILNPILNESKDRKFFRDNMNIAPKESLLKLFDIMEQESPHHKKVIEELRQELEKD